MKFRLLLILMLITSGLFSQNSKDENKIRKITPEAFYKMQYSVENQGFVVAPSEVTDLMEAGAQLAYSGKMDTLSLIRLHTRCRELMYFALREKKRTMDTVKVVFQRLDKTLNTFLDCDKEQARYKEIFLKDSTSKQTLETVVTGLQKCDCIGTDLYMKTSKRLYDMDTTHEKALWVARYFLRKSGYGFALPLLQRAANSTNPLIASEAYMEIAGSYRFYNRMEEAVRFARKAIELNPANGMAYVIIGDIYFLTAGNCGITDIEKTAALWASYDKYQKGLKADASIKDIVKVRSAVLNHRFPDSKALAELKLVEGTPYKINCWIQEKTTVKARKN